MYIYIYMCVYIYMYIYLFICVHMYVCTSAAESPVATPLRNTASFTSAGVIASPSGP